MERTGRRPADLRYTRLVSPLIIVDGWYNSWRTYHNVRIKFRYLIPDIKLGRGTPAQHGSFESIKTCKLLF